ncbi:MAG: arylamine N-acetyltransferase [bacterium]|nr:arylamine N-acetyltransferase [bacterium]
MFNQEKYLKLLGLEAEQVSLKFLKKLHLHHLYKFPFENLDIHLKRPIVLDVEKIASKMLDQERGGFCYELNGLFFELLKSLNFDCFIISAEVWFNEKWGPPYDHMAIVVKFEDKSYLCDVGFGDSFTYPKEIKFNEWQIDGNSFFRIIAEEEVLFLEKSPDMQKSEAQYRFTLQPRQYIEFIGMCDYQQTDPTSHFTQKKVISKLTKTGRITLNDDKLTITELNQKNVQPIHSKHEFDILLKEHFGYDFSES